MIFWFLKEEKSEGVKQGFGLYFKRSGIEALSVWVIRWVGLG